MAAGSIPVSGHVYGSVSYPEPVLSCPAGERYSASPHLTAAADVVSPANVPVDEIEPPAVSRQRAGTTAVRTVVWPGRRFELV